MGLIYNRHTMLASGDGCYQPSGDGKCMDAINPACVKMNFNFPNDLILKIKN